MTDVDLVNVMDGALRELADAVRGRNPGIKRAPPYPPNTIATFPFLVTLPGSGTWVVNSDGWATGLVDVVMELHMAEGDLSAVVEDTLKYATAIPTALFRARAAVEFNVVQTFGDVSWEFRGLGWAGANTIGWRFIINDVKVLIEF